METLKGFHLKQLRVKHLDSLTTQCLVLLIIPNWKINWHSLIRLWRNQGFNSTWIEGWHYWWWCAMNFKWLFWLHFWWHKARKIWWKLWRITVGTYDGARGAGGASVGRLDHGGRGCWCACGSRGACATCLVLATTVAVLLPAARCLWRLLRESVWNNTWSSGRTLTWYIWWDRTRIVRRIYWWDYIWQLWGFVACILSCIGSWTWDWNKWR